MEQKISHLPIIESCDACGACCLVVTRPPFRQVFHESGEEAWERLRRERPDLVNAFLDDYHTSQQNGGPFFGTPCLWYDPSTRRCRHYEFRPRACREFEVGSGDCRDARRRAGVH